MMPQLAPEAVGLGAARLAHIDALIARYLATHPAPGILTLVARHGRLAYLACAGSMDRERNRPVQPDTLFRIYSMTKPITCLALLMLVEAGRLQLDDPVARYLPAFARLKVSATGPVVAPLQRPISICDLLTHTAGLGYGLFDDAPVEAHYRAARLLTRVLTLRVSLADLVEHLSQLPLADQPGTRWRYSFAHDVIAHLIATVADLPFATFLSERIFQPLGMHDTNFAVAPSHAARLAALYVRDEMGGLRLLDDPATSPYLQPGVQPAGGGGLVSTAGDYLRFAQMLLNQGTLEGVRLVTSATVALMTGNHLPANALPFSIGPAWSWPGYGYGLGLAVLLDPALAGLPGTAGVFEWPGAANTMFWVDPHQQLIGMFMTQILPSPANPPLALHFRRLVYAAVTRA